MRKFISAALVLGTVGTFTLGTPARSMDHGRGAFPAVGGARSKPRIAPIVSKTGMITLCHRSPNPHVEPRTILVGPPAVAAHLAHGDTLGACEARSEWTATTVVGAQETSATSFGLGSPAGVAIDAAGRIYVTDYANNRIDRIDGTTITRFAGTGVGGYSGDGGPATAAQVNPTDVALDAQGRLYIADGNNNCVRRVDTKGFITRIAGACGSFYTYYVPGTNNTGDGGPALEATFAGPGSVAVDAQGRVYIVDVINGVVRRIDENGIIDRVAGTGNVGMGGDDGPATSADLNNPSGISVGPAGELYIADRDNGAIRRVDHPGPPSQPGTIHTVAGVLGAQGLDPDGPVATTRLSFPSSAVVDPNGVLTVTDTLSNRIRQVIGSDIVTVAGSESGAYGFAGDGGPARSALLASPGNVAFDATGRMLIADTVNNRIRRVDTNATHTIDTIAGSGSLGVDGDHAAATSAPRLAPWGVATDAQGNVYFSDGFDAVSQTSRGRVRRVDPSGTIITFAGGPFDVYSPIPDPEGVAVDSQGRVYVIDTAYSVVWRADASGLVRVAGGGTSTTEGALATDADLYGARTIAFDAMGRLYVSIGIYYAHVVRRIDVPDGTHGTIVTVVGGGSDTGDTRGPGAPLQAQLNFPRGMAFDANGRLYVADAGASRIVRVDFDAPSVTRIAGGVGNTQSGENVPPLTAKMTPFYLALDALGNVFYSDTTDDRVRRIDAGLTAVTTVAGSQTLGHSGDFGDGGPATGAVDGARLLAPRAIAIDPEGRLLIADTSNNRVRRVGQDGIITTIAGAVSPEGMGQVAQARLFDPRALAVADGMTLVAGGVSGTVQAVRGDWLDAVAGRYAQSQSTQDLAKFRDRTFGTVGAITVDPASGALFVTESDRIHKVTMYPFDDANSWTMAGFANEAGVPGYADGPVATAEFRSPGGLHHDGQDLYVADTGNHVIRRISGSGVTTIAGRGEQSGFAGDGGPALDALLDGPEAITECPNGDLFIADTGNNRVRRIHQGVISTVLGTGVEGSSGEGAPATSFPVDRPKGLVCDASGNLYVASTDTVRRLPARGGVVDGTGAVSTIYGPSKYGCLTGLALLDADTLRVADQCTGVLLELRRQTVPN